MAQEGPLQWSFAEHSKIELSGVFGCSATLIALFGKQPSAQLLATSLAGSAPKLRPPLPQPSKCPGEWARHMCPWKHLQKGGIFFNWSLFTLLHGPETALGCLLDVPIWMETCQVVCSTQNRWDGLSDQDLFLLLRVVLLNYKVEGSSGGAAGKCSFFWDF